MATRPVTVNDVLDGHVVLDLEGFDRTYLNGYVPNLQVGGQVVNFLTSRGFPIPSPALLEQNGTRFRRAVESYAQSNGIPWVRFARDERKPDVMRPHLHRLARPGRCGVAAIGVAQEFQRVFTATTSRPEGGGVPHFGFTKADRRVTAYYFYLVDETFGPAFIKICAYFPYPVKIWLNGHEYAKRKAAAAGITFTALANGFAATDDPAGLQDICDELECPAPSSSTPPQRPDVLRGAVCGQPRHRPPGGDADRVRRAGTHQPRSAATAAGCLATATRSPSTPTSATLG